MRRWQSRVRQRDLAKTIAFPRLLLFILASYAGGQLTPAGVGHDAGSPRISHHGRDQLSVRTRAGFIAGIESRPDKKVANEADRS
jgi:hypothetical protein